MSEIKIDVDSPLRSADGGHRVTLRNLTVDEVARVIAAVGRCEAARTRHVRYITTGATDE